MFSVLNFLSDAVQLKPASKYLKIRLASLLTGYHIYRRYRNEGHDEGQELVRECEVGQCSSEICHKIGKFYSNPVHINESIHHFFGNLEFIVVFLESCRIRYCKSTQMV